MWLTYDYVLRNYHGKECKMCYDWMCNIVFFLKSIFYFSASPSSIIFYILKSMSNSTTIYVVKAFVTIELIIYSLDEHLVAKTFSLVISIMLTPIFFLVFINYRIPINFDHTIRDEHPFWYKCGWGTLHIIFCLLFRFIKFYNSFALLTSWAEWVRSPPNTIVFIRSQIFLATIGINSISSFSSFSNNLHAFC
jgi:hypothetical protein